MKLNSPFGSKGIGGFLADKSPTPCFPSACRRVQEHSQQTPQTEMSTKHYRQQLKRCIEHARAGFLVIVLAIAAIVIIIYGLLQP
jgi:hypothetical protein